MSTSPGRLNGKVVILTASTGGIGFAVARRLGHDGASIVVSSRKEKNVQRAETQLQKEGLRVLGVVCHVANAEHRKNLINKTLERFGGIDILISNAAANPHVGNILDTSEEAWDKILETNIKATFFLCKEISPYIEKRGGGSIVIVSSVSGYFHDPILKGIGAYSVSKTALLGLTKALAPQLATMNIRVNCLAPGLIDTKFGSVLAGNPELREGINKTTILNRVGKPEECAGAVSFLVSSDASFITGEVVSVSGGISARL